MNDICGSCTYYVKDLCYALPPSYKATGFSARPAVLFCDRACTMFSRNPRSSSDQILSVYINPIKDKDAKLQAISILHHDLNVPWDTTLKIVEEGGEFNSTERVFLKNKERLDRLTVSRITKV